MNPNRSAIVATLPVNLTSVVTAGPSRQTMESVLVKALKFLRAVGASPPIATSLAKAGYTAADSTHAFALVHAVVGVPTITAAENPVTIASAEIEQCRKTLLPIAEAALGHLHPEQAAFVFDRLDLGDPSEAVVTVSLVLERVSQLESAKDRKATHKADLAAVATLESRGFTKAERKRLSTIIAFILTNTAPVLEEVPNAEVQQEKLVELKAWLDEWTSVAKVVIKRRDLLVRLGIGKRRPKKAATAPAIPVATPTTPPVATTPAAPVVTAPPVATPIAGTPAVGGAAEEPSPNSSGPSAPQRAVRAA